MPESNSTDLPIEAANDGARERILFVTGRLAEQPVRRVVDALSKQVGFDYEIAVLGASVAALLSADLIARKLEISSKVDRAILPGWCQGDLGSLAAKFQIPFELGPKDIFDLPQRFGRQRDVPTELKEFDIQILAEINHAPRMTDVQIVTMAESYWENGADLIDLGCIPGESWQRAGDVTRLLCDLGFCVSIDSFDRSEVEAAVENGADLILSCNSQNVSWIRHLETDVVVIPDDPLEPGTLERTIDILTDQGARFRVDPVLEPIGFGFAASLSRYFEVRKTWPDVDILMGVGNVTELSEVDSAGINFLLAGICQELRIKSVLTTEVVNWARSSVREFDLARRLVYYSINQNVLPKHVDSRLVMLRDAKLSEYGEQGLSQLAGQLKDRNFRIFVERGEVHIMNRDGYWRGTDPFQLFDDITRPAEGLDPSHAFYLGYELCKAVTALTLGKKYTQDAALQWGFLTIGEESAIERRKHAE